jgi:hypothetical protein
MLPVTADNRASLSIAITSRQAIFQRNQFAEQATFDRPE